MVISLNEKIVHDKKLACNLGLLQRETSQGFLSFWGWRYLDEPCARRTRPWRLFAKENLRHNYWTVCERRLAA